MNFGRSLAGSPLRSLESSRRAWRRTAWSDGVGSGLIVTAVAGLSNKVGGKKTQKWTVRPLERSAQLRAAISQNELHRHTFCAFCKANIGAAKSLHQGRPEGVLPCTSSQSRAWCSIIRRAAASSSARTRSLTQSSQCDSPLLWQAQPPGSIGWCGADVRRCCCDHNVMSGTSYDGLSVCAAPSPDLCQWRT